MDILLGLSYEHLLTSDDASDESTLLTLIDGVEISERSIREVGLGLSSIAGGYVRISVMGDGDSGVMTVKGLSGIYKPFKLQKNFAACLL